MNSNRKVFLFVISSLCIYLLASLLAIIFHFNWLPYQRVNLISELFQQHSLEKQDSTSINEPVIVEDKPHESFDLYKTPHLITDFNTDTTQPALQRFISKLYELKNGKKRKIRIAYFGDSMIEGDLLTQTLRELLQKTFGGSGVGYVPITSQVSKFRSTVSANYSDGWKDENFKTEGSNKQLYISGHIFRAHGDWVQMTDQTIEDSSTVIEKSLLCGYLPNPTGISVNDHSFTINATDTFNRILIDKGNYHGIKVAIANEQLPVYGISFESDSGIFVDNFSFRGITGIEFSKIDSAFIASVAQGNPYDLVVFQYGVNLLFRPNEKNFSWYAKMLTPVLRKLRNCFKQSDFILVSTADRAFKYGDEYRSATGIDSLIKVQALLAFENDCSFYNQFKTMGGTNSIVEWASRNPSLANKDYVHPNHRGAEVLGRYFYEAIINDYNKYVHLKASGK
jgi:lysophospholipase L1-like esterase